MGSTPIMSFNIFHQKVMKIFNILMLALGLIWVSSGIIKKDAVAVCVGCYILLDTKISMLEDKLLNK